MADSRRSEKIELLQEQVNQRVREAVAELQRELRERLRRAGDQIVGEMDRELESGAPHLPDTFLSGDELEPLAEEAGSTARRETVSMLVSALAAVDRAASQAAILATLCREATRFAGRSALFLARADELELWGAEGWDESMEGTRIAYPDAGPWSRASLGSGSAELSTGDCGTLCSLVDAPLPHAGTLVPLVLRDRLAAVLYADHGEGEELLVEALQALTYAGALALETLPFRDRAATPTLSRASAGGAALEVWSGDGEAAAAEPAAPEAAAPEAATETPAVAAPAEEEPEAEESPAGSGEEAAAPAAADGGAVGAAEAGFELSDEAASAGDEAAGEVDLYPGGDELYAGEEDLFDGEDTLGDEEPGEVLEATDDAQPYELEVEEEAPDVADEAPEVGEEAPALEEEAPAVEPAEPAPAAWGGAAADEAPDDEVAGGDGTPSATAGFAAPLPAEPPPAEPPPSGPPPSEPPAAEVAAPAAPAEVEEVSADDETADLTPPAAPVPPPPAAAPAAGSQVAPPSDVEGPGRAFGAGEPSGDDEARHEEARRLARLLVSEIRLYNEEEVDEGRRHNDVYARLKEDIDRSRQMYEERVDPAIRETSDYFYQELVRNLGGGDEKALGI